MDWKTARRVWPAEPTTCLDCGRTLPTLKRTIWGWGIQCPECLVKRLEAPATGERTDPHTYDVREA
jgi:hypothetical protein